MMIFDQLEREQIRDECSHGDDPRKRRGNTTVPNRSTAINNKLRTDTRVETSVAKELSLHIAWPRGPLTSQWPAVFIFTEILGKWKIGNNRSEIAMFTTKMLIGVLGVFVL